MKKKLIYGLLLLLISCLYAQENIKKISSFEHKNEAGFLFRRDISKLVGESDETGNGLLIDDRGNLYIVQCDMHKLYQVNIADNNLRFIKDLDFLEYGSEGLTKITDDYYFCTGGLGRFKLLDKDFNMKFNIRMLNWDMWIDSAEVYYDEKTNIIFFQDRDRNMHSIIHPGMNDEENRKNYKNPEETLKLFTSGYDMKNLGLYKDKYLTVDGQVYYWAGKTIGKFDYQIISNNRVYLYSDSPTIKIYCTSENEEIESIAIHPCGDIYILRMDWQTNTHNLYCIENTWDPDYREEWYKNHSTDNSSQTASSATIVIDQQMSCIDNLSLRSEGSVSASVITTMKKGTKVKVLKLGNTETIDGMNSNWVQVEVLSGAKDQKGKKIKAGTIGWCYGGYLE